MEAFAAILLGAAFGFMLHKAGLTHYDKIVNVYRFRDLTVMKFMLSALCVGATLVEIARSLGLVADLPVPPTALVANLVGGVIFGVGMALAGYCPGTIVAEAGEGRIDAWIPGLSGLFAGALAFGLAYPYVMPPLRRFGNVGATTLSASTGASRWLVLVVFVELVVLVLVVIERHERRARAPAPAWYVEP